jgi:hypothetical protein
MAHPWLTSSLLRKITSFCKSSPCPLCICPLHLSFASVLPCWPQTPRAKSIIPIYHLHHTACCSRAEPSHHQNHARLAWQIKTTSFQLSSQPGKFLPPTQAAVSPSNYYQENIPYAPTSLHSFPFKFRLLVNFSLLQNLSAHHTYSPHADASVFPHHHQILARHSNRQHPARTSGPVPRP